MVKVVVRRVVQLVPILLGLSIIAFAWVRALPGDPSAALLSSGQGTADPSVSREAVAEVRRLYGLDRPLHEQYRTWLGRVVRLDLGQSITTRENVTDALRRRFPATVELAVAALLVAVAVGVPLGAASARRARSWFDHVSLGGCLLAISVPTFLLAFALKYVFSVKLGWLPSVGRLDVTREASHPTGFFVLDAIVSLDGAALIDAVRHLVLPVIALAAVPAAFIARITRASVLEVTTEDYVRTADAKGMSRRIVNRRYVLRNALLPVLTIVGLTMGFLLSGAVLVEAVFAWGGIGTMLQQAVADRDYPVLQAGILLIAVVFVVVNLLVDLGYAVLDPRVRVQ
ncbi:MAG: ABC transporter permease [Actinomycetota bacterium]|nr:ABC transporter permease [Actinomycetota bacterium]